MIDSRRRCRVAPGGRCSCTQDKAVAPWQDVSSPASRAQVSCASASAEVNSNSLGTGSSKHAAAHQEAWRRALGSSCGLPGRGKRRSFEAVLPPATPCGEQDQDFNEIRSTAHGEPSVSCQSSIGICSTRTINGIRISLQPRMVFEGSGILARSLTAGPLLASIESQHPLDTKRLITASPRLRCSPSVLQIASKRATPLRRMRLLEPGREDAPQKVQKLAYICPI